MTNLIDEMFDPSQITGIRTGYPNLDLLCGGLKAGSLYIIAGATGMGKSLFGLNILVNLAKEGVHSTYYDLENGRGLSNRRILRIKYGLEDSFFDDMGNKEKAEQMLMETPIQYWSHVMLDEWKTDQKVPLNVLLTRLISAERLRCDVFLIDPLQALETSYSSDDLLQEQGSIVKELKELAQKYNKIIILCHHMRKSVGGSGNWLSDVDDSPEVKYRIPSIDDLRGSGKITDYATDVWGIVRPVSSPTPNGRGKTLVRVLKNRTGLSGDVKLFMDEKTLIFTERTNEYF